MTLKTWIGKWVNKEKHPRKQASMTSTPNDLYSYATRIAWHNDDGTIGLNAKKYSVTTSKQQTYIRWNASAAGIPVIETK